jgi:hypothetical protein
MRMLRRGLALAVALVGLVALHGCGDDSGSGADGGRSEPDCSDASVVSETSCEVPGCVPGYASGIGDPDPSTAVCVPIQSGTCVSSCERVEPACPTGTVPERDGFCYTDRCVPAFVCE